MYNNRKNTGRFVRVVVDKSNAQRLEELRRQEQRSIRTIQALIESLLIVIALVLLVVILSGA